MNGCELTSVGEPIEPAAPVVSDAALETFNAWEQPDLFVAEVERIFALVR